MRVLRFAFGEFGGQNGVASVGFDGFFFRVSRVYRYDVFSQVLEELRLVS